ncbi:hypothetical protein Tco_0227033 [Tanacetum coccineum]
MVFLLIIFDNEGFRGCDFTNLETVVNVSPIPTSRIISSHPSALILGDPTLAVQTRSKVNKSSGAYAFVSYIYLLWEEGLSIGTKVGFIEIRRMRGGVVVRKSSKDLFSLLPLHGIHIYQYGCKKCFLYGKLDEEVYVSQTTGFLDPKYPKEGLKVVISSLWVTSKSQSMNLGVVMEFDALRRVRFRCPLVKDGGSQDVDVIFIGSLQKSSHLSAVKRIFRYLKGKPKLGLWYPRVSTFDLESYSDSDYTGANLDRKSTTGGCQFLGQGLIFGDAKKETIVATSTTEAEYVAAANCCGQVLWIQNQMLDYGFNFMNTKIYIDNGKSTFEL